MAAFLHPGCPMLDDLARRIAAIADALREEDYEPVGALLSPMAPGQFVTLWRPMGEHDAFIHRIVLAEGMTPGEVADCIASFRRQLAVQAGGFTTGFLALLFDGPAPAEVRALVKRAPQQAPDRPGEYRLSVGVFAVSRGRFTDMNAAPRGILAEEIMGCYEARRIVRSAGGGGGDGPRVTRAEAAERILRMRKPVRLLWLLLAANGVVFLMMAAGGAGTSPRTLVEFGALFGPLIGRGEVWRLLTAMFIHIGILHLGFNSYVLYVLGRDAEAIFGSVRFGLVYLMAGLAGGIASACMTHDRISAGASGAIFGLGGALIAFAIVNRRFLPASAFARWMKNLGMFVIVNLAFGLSVPNIDNYAHLGGLVGGFLFGAALTPRMDDPGRFSWRNLMVAPLAALVGLGVVASVELNARPDAVLGGLGAREQGLEDQRSVVSLVERARRMVVRASAEQDRPVADRAADCEYALTLLDGAAGRVREIERSRTALGLEPRLIVWIEAEKRLAADFKAWLEAPDLDKERTVAKDIELANRAERDYHVSLGKLLPAAPR